MSQANHVIADPPPTSGGAPEELAARLASKLCHDFISPAGAIVSGLDLLDDPTAKDMREEAMELIASSARKLVDLLAFDRVAYGAAGGAEIFDCAELKRLTLAVYTHVRAELDWAATPPSLPKAAARVLVNLAQIAAGALPLGGVARIEAREEGAHYVIEVVGKGPKARLHAEVLAGLLGEPLGEGLGGRWVQAYYAHAVAVGAGGGVDASASDELVTLRARVPV
jgi:histidine phosphotransferase ChpT